MMSTKRRDRSCQQSDCLDCTQCTHRGTAARSVDAATRGGGRRRAASHPAVEPRTAHGEHVLSSSAATPVAFVCEKKGRKKEEMVSICAPNL